MDEETLKQLKQEIGRRISSDEQAAVDEALVKKQPVEEK